MDIKTPKGQVTALDEKRAAYIFEAYFPEYRYDHTDKDKPICFDAHIVRRSDNKPIGIVETKCRYDMDIYSLANNRNSEWLITYDKIERCIDVAKEERVIFFGFLYLAVQDVLLVMRIWDKKWLLPYRLEYTSTTRTVNDSEPIMRYNAFLKVSKAKVLGLKRK